MVWYLKRLLSVLKSRTQASGFASGVDARKRLLKSDNFAPGFVTFSF